MLAARRVLHLARRDRRLFSSAAGVLPFDTAQAVPSFAGEVAIVTGGSVGIGGATSAVLAKAGARVHSLDISPPPEPIEGVTHVAVDVSDVSALTAAIKEVAATEGRIDHLISNAGVWHGGPEMEDVTEAEFDRVVGINVKGAYFAVAAAVPTMKAQGSGSIVIVGSDQSFIGKPTQNLYGMTKAAVAQLSKSCAAQYAPLGIRVNCVCPGTIATPLMDNAVDHLVTNHGAGTADDLHTWLQTAQPVPRVGMPEEVAHTIAFMSKVPFMVGAQVSVDGGYVCQ